MLHSALTFLTNELNGFLKLKTGDTDTDRVYLTSVATESKGVVIPDNSIGVSLINIEEDRINKDQSTSVINSNGDVEYRNPELRVNLYILISANFQNADSSSSADYAEGLKQLSHIISFFQAKNVFTPENTPALSTNAPELKKLVVELYSYSFEQLYNFWSVVGTKYLPSVLYKVRIITFREDDISATGKPIEKISIESKNKE